MTVFTDNAALAATTRDAYNRQVENAALATYDLAITDARHILAATIGADSEQQAEPRTLARARIERAGLDVCRALGEATQPIGDHA